MYSFTEQIHKFLNHLENNPIPGYKVLNGFSSIYVGNKHSSVKITHRMSKLEVNMAWIDEDGNLVCHHQKITNYDDPCWPWKNIPSSDNTQFNNNSNILTIINSL